MRTLELPKRVTFDDLQELVINRFGGMIDRGHHPENGKACALELRSVALGIPWTDNPELTRDWELRHINDMNVPGQVRAKHFLPVIAAYGGALDWHRDRQIAVVSRLLVLTFSRMLPLLPSLSSGDSATLQNIRGLEDIPPQKLTSVCGYDGWPYDAAMSAFAHIETQPAYAAERIARAATLTAIAVNPFKDQSAMFVRVCELWMEAIRNLHR
jgi:hypothetical protein